MTKQRLEQMKRNILSDIFFFLAGVSLFFGVYWFPTIKGAIVCFGGFPIFMLLASKFLENPNDKTK